MGQEMITQNTYCGTLYENLNTYTDMIQCDGLVSGRYMSLQVKEDKFMEIDNIYVCKKIIINCVMYITEQHYLTKNNDMPPNYQL